MKRWSLTSMVGVILMAASLHTASANQQTGQYLGIANNAFYGWACLAGDGRIPMWVELYVDAGPDQGGRPVAQSLNNLPSSNCRYGTGGWQFDIPTISGLVEGRTF